MSERMWPEGDDPEALELAERRAPSGTLGQDIKNHQFGLHEGLARFAQIITSGVAVSSNAKNASAKVARGILRMQRPYPKRNRIRTGDIRVYYRFIRGYSERYPDAGCGAERLHVLPQSAGNLVVLAIQTAL